MLKYVCRRPSDPSEVVSTMWEQDAPEMFANANVVHPSPDLVFEGGVIDDTEDWGTWIERFGMSQKPPILFWSV